MPKKQPFQKITNRELEIMQLLWNAIIRLLPLKLQP